MPSLGLMPCLNGRRCGSSAAKNINDGAKGRKQILAAQGAHDQVLIQARHNARPLS